MIDLHCHVLPGIDDGPETLEGSLALARASLASGTRTLVATPHVSFRYRNDSGQIRDLVDELNRSLQAEGVALDVRAGAEVAATRALDIERGELRRLGLGGGPWLLLEPAFTIAATGLDTAIASLRRDGFHVLLAHPERCPAFHRHPAALHSLVRSGVLTSVTSGSFVGRFGKTVQRFAQELADARMIHNVASDAHDLERRPPGIVPELEQAGLLALAEWLTEEVPAAILDGEESVPAPPAERVAPAGRSRWASRLGRKRSP